VEGVPPVFFLRYSLQARARRPACPTWELSAALTGRGVVGTAQLSLRGGWQAS